MVGILLTVRAWARPIQVTKMAAIIDQQWYGMGSCSQTAGFDLLEVIGSRGA